MILRRYRYLVHTASALGEGGGGAHRDRLDAGETARMTKVDGYLFSNRGALGVIGSGPDNLIMNSLKDDYNLAQLPSPSTPS